MELKLFRGEIALIDDADALAVQNYTWRVGKNGNGYPYVVSRQRVNGAPLKLHRFILKPGAGVFVDHINGNQLDNRRCNLRLCSHAENMRNTKTRSTSKTGIRNVMFGTNNGVACVVAQVMKDGKRHRKYFKTLEDAAAWANSVRINLHGDFAYPA